MDADALIETLRLAPHPEGGHYRQTWAGPDVGGRPSGTAILFLLREGERSHWHRVDAAEIWLWHAGAPLALRIAEDERAARRHLLGPEIPEQMPQILVPTGWWQSAETLGAFTLVSCTVSPGFRFEGFELAQAGFDIPEE